MTTEKVQLPPGEYFVGDLCYVLESSWDKVCDLIINGRDCRQGKFTLKDGREFAMFNTAYGDGEYLDEYGGKYGVDSGSLGCILTRDIDSRKNLWLGVVHTFDQPFYAWSDGQVIYFGHIAIDTGF